MKRFWFRILVCLVPTLLSIGVVAWAYNEYQNGRGGFVLGVDLVGGTILVYEVDESKMTSESRSSFKVEDLAAALKRRIDPADLYNVTIRPIGGTPERVEIILPTGGKHQSEVETRNWAGVLAAARKEYDVKDDLDTRMGDRSQLVDDLAKVKRVEVEKFINDATKTKDGKQAAWADVVEKTRDKYAGDAKDSFVAVPKDNLAALADAAMKPQRTRISEWVDAKTGHGDGGGKNKKMLTGEEVENIKNLIARQGRLEFRILANPDDDAAGMEAARRWFEPLNPDAKDKDANLAATRREELTKAMQKAEAPPQPRSPDGSLAFPVTLPEEPNHTYSWVEIGKSYLYQLNLNSEAVERDAANRLRVETAERTQQPFPVSNDGNPRNSSLIYVRSIPASEWARRNPKDRQQGKTREFFILVRDPLRGKEITGDYLVKANQQNDERGRPGIGFTFNSEGGALFYDVTTKNKPTSGFYRHLAIMFDGQISSAPRLQSPIRTSGQITGEFTQQEVDDSLRILRAGALPATLKKDPVSENSMGATLGADTIFWGFWSVIGAFFAVMVFMVFYYRFAGLVACVALMANLLITVACMVLLQAAFTLPGLAGLVLMLGMAVDANVLIYERLREERERGANLMLALRNGYDRAFPTILDTHLTSIFTAIVLYVVGNDQLKGFGVSLFIGLIISLFTSLYVTRTIFEIWLFKGWLKELNFFGGLVKLIHSRYWDFMSIRHYWFTGTIILTILGAVLFIYRADSDPGAGKATVLNIDFTGGTAYTGELNKPLSLTELRKKLEDTSNPLPDLSIEQIYVSGDTTAESGKSRYFTVRTSDKNSADVLEYISRKLGRGDGGEGDLKMLHLDRYAIEVGSKGAIGARLAFTDEKGNADYASQAQVQRVMSSAFIAAGKSPSAFSVERPEHRAQTWERILSAAGAAFPVLEKTVPKPTPYATVEKTEKALTPAIVADSVTPRVNAWFTENAAALKTPNEKQWADFVSKVSRNFPPAKADAYGKPKAGDTKELQTLALATEKANAEAWVKSAITGEAKDGAFSVEKNGHYSQLVVKLSDPIEPADFRSILHSVQQTFERSPQPERLEVFDRQLASNMQERAIYAILASWGAILLYLWFRFGSWTFGAATVCCLVHDLFFTLGAIAACHYLHRWAPGVASLLLIEDFKIDLPAVAALLTLVGYSVNDTIVVFDRIREVRGKNPLLTAQIINDSVNQTLTRTILASATVMVVVVVLYCLGGPNLRLFAFVMIVGVIVGTYSSIYIASPLLLIFGEGKPVPSAAERAAAAATADRG